MDIMGYPQASRDFLNEVLFDMKKAVETESSVLGREIVDHTINYLYKTGKIASLAGSIASDIKKREGGQGGGGSSSNGGSSSSGGANTDRQKFVFDPSKHPQQKRHDTKSFLCYHYVNGILRAGKLKEGNNPPDDCWFASFRELSAHKKANKCKH
jgi:hypothetical protein